MRPHPAVGGASGGVVGGGGYGTTEGIVGEGTRLRSCRIRCSHGITMDVGEGEDAVGECGSYGLFSVQGTRVNLTCNTCLLSMAVMAKA